MDDLHQERRLGTTPEHREVNELLLAVSRTARAFRLYDARNTLIRQFLADVRDRVLRFAERHGGVELEIREEEIAWQDEVVYVEADRERSLAFRLFRDGVRGLDLGGEVTFDELVSLLEVLSVRYVGVRQGEHDVVTLLRACDFQHIEVHAVEGAMDAQAERLGRGTGGVKRRFEAPADFDLPLPVLEHRTEVVYADVDYDARTALVAEVDADTIPTQTIALAHRLLFTARDRQDPTRLEDLADLFGELRDALLIERCFVEARTLYRMLGEAYADDPDRVAPLQAGFQTPRAVRAILRGSTDGRLDPDLLAYLSALRAPGPVAEGVVQALAQERGDPARAMAASLLGHLLPHFADRLEGWLHDAEAAVAEDLVRAAAPAVPGALLVALGNLGQEDLLAIALTDLEHVQDSRELTDGLVGLLANPSSAIRIRVADALARRQERGAFDALMQSIEGRAAELQPAEARAFGRAMARLLPEVAAEEFQRWLRMSGVMSRLVKTREQKMLEWAAVCGLELVDHARYDRDLMEVAKREKRGPLYELCQSTLVERRRRRRVP